ncbi:hypothetical protein BJ508DRAFT_174030 [Ascobolus immersus RN42]|uniref:Sulfate transporter family protein n=1 Tax=Ascobolus immersus RN42 TaxID=1160509 RepID=A0A3N4HTJ1_ASCIM|nr:hypothetical protein BJ508DRAFT_174030 [Ascobolus immersus RN42]
MFYVSCIVSQLVYSLGGSAFPGGVGSEMIEVVPFFHKMAYTIMSQVGKENEKAVLATTILAFSISSIITGLVFFLLGALKLGSLIGFFPRHILVGCIGGVGWFLIVTALEVCAHLDGSLTYTWDTLTHLVDPLHLGMWGIPCLLAVILMVIQHFIKHPMVVPLYFLAVPIVFYIVVLSVPSWHLENLRDIGWIFEMPEAGVPFWHFYTLYDFRAVDWKALFNTIPAMFALTFFGILHVPINVPALAISTQLDDLNLDRELRAHGISNALSGMLGSIQNYLVYTNSLLFVRCGGNSRVAGFMLAVGTAGIMMVGPVLIGYIPVMVVGALIFLLGFELLREALWDTWGKLQWIEYLTVMIIVVTMGAWDFVYGILIGILLACVSYVIQTSRVSAIRASYSGVVARSTVRRNPVQQRFLKNIGHQIRVLKLSGYMFFGTIASVEAQTKALLDEKNDEHKPIRYLILDFGNVSGLDFSAAEAFTRMRRTIETRHVEMILSGVEPHSDVGKSLRSVGVWNDKSPVPIFSDLNAALESCENEFLSAFYERRDQEHAQEPDQNRQQPIPADNNQTLSPASIYGTTPRSSNLLAAVRTTLKEEGPLPMNRYASLKEPLPLILQTFEKSTDKNEDFWFRLCRYLERVDVPAGTTLFKVGDTAKSFYILESGILRCEYELEQGNLTECIVAGTTCGELPFFSETARTATVTAERDSVAWELTSREWEKIKKDDSELAGELLKVSMKLTTERMAALTSYVLTSS